MTSYLFFRHCCYFGKEEFFQGLCHDDNVFASLVVDITVSEDGVEVLDTLFSRKVIVVLQTLFDAPEIHGVLDDLVVVGQIQLDGVHRGVEGPPKLMLPHGFHDGVPQIHQL